MEFFLSIDTFLMRREGVCTDKLLRICSLTLTKLVNDKRRKQESAHFLYKKHENRDQFCFPFAAAAAVVGKYTTVTGSVDTRTS